MPRRNARPWSAAAVALAILSLPVAASAQAVDCTGLRQQIEASRSDDGGRLGMAIRQQRAEIERTRAYADDNGCDGAGFFDDPNSSQCRMLNRRLQQLQAGLQRLQDQASGGDPDRDDRRRALVEQFNAYCAGAGDEAAEPRSPNIMSVDPDAEPNGTPAPRTRFAQVMCVRQCDGAYYPLAVDVASDRLDGMDKLCKAQCPNADSAAYTSRDGEDMSNATAADGSTYGSLPSAFKFRTGVTPSCTCRAPHQSWAEALSQADAMLESHKGDVTVTPEIAAAMARPVSPAPSAGAVATKAVNAKPANGRKPTTSAPLVVPSLRRSAPPRDAADSGSNPGEDLTRQFRRAAPTL